MAGANSSAQVDGRFDFFCARQQQTIPVGQTFAAEASVSIHSKL